MYKYRCRIVQVQLKAFSSTYLGVLYLRSSQNHWIYVYRQIVSHNYTLNLEGVEVSCCGIAWNVTLKFILLINENCENLTIVSVKEMIYNQESRRLLWSQISPGPGGEEIVS
jgi:hypothetical protein